MPELVVVVLVDVFVPPGTGPAASDVATVDPFLFVAVTATRTVAPASALGTV